MKSQFFVDEESMANKILKNGFSGGEFNGYEAYLIAKYYRHSGNGDRKTKNLLIDFCIKNDMDFNEIRHLSDLNKIVKSSRAEWKKSSDMIIITKSEIDEIKKIKNFSAQKILIVFLIFAKRNNGFVYSTSWSDIKKISRMKISTKQLYYYVHLAYKQGLLRDSNENHFIKFINENSSPEIVLSEERDVWNIIKKYEEYCGGELGYCKECEKEFIKSGKNHYYCEEHTKERFLKRYKKYNKKR